MIKDILLHTHPQSTGTTHIHQEYGCRCNHSYWNDESQYIDINGQQTTWLVYRSPSSATVACGQNYTNNYAHLLRLGSTHIQDNKQQEIREKSRLDCGLRVGNFLTVAHVLKYRSNSSRRKRKHAHNCSCELSQLDTYSLHPQAN